MIHLVWDYFRLGACDLEFQIYFLEDAFTTTVIVVIAMIVMVGKMVCCRFMYFGRAC